MTHKSLLLCTAMAFAAATPQMAQSQSMSDGAQGAFRLAQATPPAEEKDRRQPPGQHPGAQPPGQHPPGAAVPPPQQPGRPGGPATAQPVAPPQQHPGAPTPPASAQTPPPAPGQQHPPAAAVPGQMQPRQGAAPVQPGTTLPPAAAVPGQMQPHQGAAPVQPGTTLPPAAAVPGQLQPRQGAAPVQPGATPAPAAAMPGQMQPRQGAAPVQPAAMPAGHYTPAPAVPVDPKTMPQRLDQVRAERHEVVEGNRTVITESNRTIIREGGVEIIRHDPVDRFRFNAREVNVERHGANTVTVVVRPDGMRIVTEVDESGRLLRRIRRDLTGREFVLIDNSFEPRGPGFAGFMVDLRPPVVSIAPQLYIRPLAGATLLDISATLMAPPVERIERRYALDEILYNEPLRARMPRIDIDTVNFETASWEITPDQSDRLSVVAQGIKAAITKNPGEMFLVEGYTDAVGNATDNLSLSDHRAESVAVMLTNNFGIPAENLTTQGYGKQFLKVPTDAPERANRRVAVRRITPLLNGGQS
jgi:outer membrane protein OmpA-like peptidoglycan-associated protein